MMGECRENEFFIIVIDNYGNSYNITLLNLTNRYYYSNIRINLLLYYLNIDAVSLTPTLGS